MKVDNKNIMLLGVPRSGTTLACHLINKIPNAVALHEPLIPKDFMGEPPIEVINKIGSFINTQRLSLLSDGNAVSKTLGGIVPDNHLKAAGSGAEKRVATIDSTTLFIDKKLQKDFTLVIKHCSFFAGIVELLVDYYQCFAIVRNPLSTLLSWNSVELKVAHGYAPAAESFDASLKSILHDEEDVYKRQIILLTWFYNKLYEFIPRQNIILYEDIISSNGRVLECIIPAGTSLSRALKSKNNNPLYDSDLKIFLAEELLKMNEKGFLHFYTKDDVLQVLERDK